ncbi:SMI1/KNR4 family protein [Paenibacillus allorhizoplanae]|nr:SMI1/KNR4 family protein [Paenibacillus allorhizoplanae]
MKSDIVEVETQFQLKFPPDYVEFMLEANGGEGTVGERNYLRLWKIEELIQDNEEYAVHDFAPGLILIGSDGGGTAYGYDFRNEIPKLVEVDFIGLDLDSPFYSTYKFSEFIEYLYNY